VDYLIDVVNTLKKINAEKHILLFCMVTYLFVAVLYVFYLPHYNVDNTQAPLVSNSIFKRNTFDKANQGPIRIQRTDKSTFEEKKKAVADVTPVIFIAFVLIYALSGLLELKAEIPPSKNLIYNRQYSYLSLCTFRI
jgi:hypothetical protein